MKDYEADIDQAIKYLGLPNWYFKEIFGKFSSAWDDVPCSEIACCVSFEAGNLSKIYVSNYAEGMYQLYNAAGRFDHTPKLGDFIWFDYGAGVPEHTGRVIEIDSVGGYITTIEGNTNGGYVNKFTYSINDPTIFGYGHPNYTDEEFDTYNIRSVTPAGEYLIEYNTVASGGINSNPQGTGAVTGANVLNSPFGYSQGRMIEVHNQLFTGNTIQTVSVNLGTWIQGSINSSGQNAGSSTRIRTNYLNINAAYIDITCPANFRTYLCEYTAASQSTFVKRIPAGTGWLISGAGTKRIKINRDHYYRFVIGKTSNAAMTPSEFPAGYTVAGVVNDIPIDNAADNIYSIFTGNADWYTLAADNGFAVDNIPALGAVGVWFNSATNDYHVANLEIYQDNTWYISECFDTGFRFSNLDSNNIPVDLSGYTLIGFIHPYQVDYPPVGAIPEVPEAPEPYKKKIFYWLKRRPF